MILHGILHFLRVHELIDFELTNFHKNCTLADEFHGPTAFVVSIKGKTDQDIYKDLAMYRDDECPEFCLVRHLMVYIKYANINSKCKYLYPDLGSMINGTYKPVPYQLFLENMKYLIVTVLGRTMTPTSIFGTHILRKTGYLFAIWGCMDKSVDSPKIGTQRIDDLRLGSIMQSARHQKIQNAMIYARDAFTQWNYEQHNYSLVQNNNKLGKWKSCYKPSLYCCC